jgi:hypothetical protein
VDVHTYRERVLRELRTAYVTWALRAKNWIEDGGNDSAESLDELQGRRDAVHDMYLKIKSIPTRDLRKKEKP